MNQDLIFSQSALTPLTEFSVKEISRWQYPEPYHEYSYLGHCDEYLLDRSTWGTEQFCLMIGTTIVGQVACQMDQDTMWVGWSMAPRFCGCGYGSQFVSSCVHHLRSITHHQGMILLRVSARNLRAIKAYQKAGFQYKETILDEIAFSGHTEDFWVMELT